MPRETENTPVVAAAISPTFDEAAYQSHLEAEAFAEVEHETADIPSTYDLPAPPQEADSEPCGKGGFAADEVWRGWSEGDGAVGGLGLRQKGLAAL